VKNWLAWGAGPRAAQNIVLTAKARAILYGRYAVTAEDIRAMAYPVLRHRIFTNFNADAEGVDVNQVIEKLLETVPEPTYGESVGGAAKAWPGDGNTGDASPGGRRTARPTGVAVESEQHGAWHATTGRANASAAGTWRPADAYASSAAALGGLRARANQPWAKRRDQSVRPRARPGLFLDSDRSRRSSWAELCATA
jgi:hypothetical protein